LSPTLDLPSSNSSGHISNPIPHAAGKLPHMNVRSSNHMSHILELSFIRERLSSVFDQQTFEKLFIGVD
jgi:hypothetical protein